MVDPVGVLDDRFSEPEAVALTWAEIDSGAGVDVTVQGVAERVFDQATLGDVARGFAQRWDGRWVFELVDGHLEHVSTGPVVLFRVRPKKVIAFGKRPSSQTTFRLS